MACALRISEAVSLGLHGTALVAAGKGRRLSAGEMAKALGASEAHLAKVMQRLARAGLVRSVRGPKGGFELGKPGQEISLLDISEAVEGPLAESSCLFEKPVCDGNCMLGGLLDTVNRLVRETLAGTRLGEIKVGKTREVA